MSKHVKRYRAVGIITAAFAIAAAWAIVSASGSAQQPTSPLAERAGPPLRVLIFSKTAGFRHDSIEPGVDAVKKIGLPRGWKVDHTEDGAAFTEQNLATYDVVIWLNTSGDVLDEPQQVAFEKFIEGGGGYVGLHAASDTEYDWPWYGKLVGAYFRGHPGNPNVRPAVYIVEDRTHPATKMLPEKWEHTDEQYSYRQNPRDEVKVLISVDEASYDPGPRHAMGDHPMAWYRFVGKGRSFYTNMGHTAETFGEQLFISHITEAILWAAGYSEPHE